MLLTHRFHPNQRVSFPGIGKGTVVALHVSLGRPFYYVRFNACKIPHLCAEHEIYAVELRIVRG